MSEIDSTYYTNTYLNYDQANLGIVQVSDLHRIILEGGLLISDQELLFFCQRLDLPTLQDNDEHKIHGFNMNEFMMFLSRDMDVFTYNHIKMAFEFFDHDKNGLISFEDFRHAISPQFYDPRMIEELMLEVEAETNVNVIMTGITLRQFQMIMATQVKKKR